MTRTWLILFACLFITGGGCSPRQSGPTNVVGFQLPTHASRQIRKGQYYDVKRSTMEGRLQEALNARFTWDGMTGQYESRQGKFVLQLFGNQTGIERATLRLHRIENMSDPKQREARERELKAICKVLMLGEDGTNWILEATCRSVAKAIKEATEVHEFGKTTYALKAFKDADAEIDNEPTNPRLWISIGPHIEFEEPEKPAAK